jgi:hypothetical protein
MDVSAKAISGLLGEQEPDAYCYPCLATTLGLAENQVRDGAQMLLLRPEALTRMRLCGRCAQRGEMLEIASHGTCPTV